MLCASFSASNHFRALSPPRWIIAFLLALCCLGLWTPSALAQDVKNAQNAADFKQRSDVHVDPSTLSMQLQIPLGSYPGRGGVNFPITLYYSPKLWRMDYVASYARGNNHRPDNGGLAHLDPILLQNRSITGNNFKWVDHPGPPMVGTYPGRPTPITNHFSRFNFSVKVMNGNQGCEVKFHAQIIYDRGFTITWGRGNY